MTLPFSAGPELSEAGFRGVRLRTIFDFNKWDPQVGDASVLAKFPVLLRRAAWRELAAAAEELAVETVAAEQEILGNSALLRELGLPRAIWKLLAAARWTAWPARPRVMRFDFHFTSEGWRISEVNSDVPGGFIEAGGFTGLMAHACGLESTGNPAAALADALVRAAGVAQPAVALGHASAYSDDRQVAACLARELQKRGAAPVMIDPSQLLWSPGRVCAETSWFRGEVHAIHRFFPAEWLPNLRPGPWQPYFAPSTVPQCNPAAALVSQSKRFGLLLPQLATPAPRWRTLLPETREARPQLGGDWIFKPAMGRVGEGIVIEGVTPEKEAREMRRSMFFFPGQWIAQRRFESLPVDTPMGAQHLCLGVYTIDGRAAGIYGRSSSKRIIDQCAADVAVLLKE
jgi:glutathionylspermidine synthase